MLAETLSQQRDVENAFVAELAFDGQVCIEEQFDFAGGGVVGQGCERASRLRCVCLCVVL